MQFSDALEVAIGLTFVFLLVSLALTAIVEFIEAQRKTRGFSLHDGVVEMLDDAEHPGSGKAAAKSVYSHPLVQGLYIGQYETAIEKKLLPSYLPSRNFALALLDQVMAGRVNAAPSVASLPAQAPLDDRLCLAAERVENEQLRRTLLLAVKVGGNDIERVTRHLEDWFNGAMERVSGRYKRRSQKMLFWIGLLSAVLLNVNTLTIADALSKDATLRRAVVAQAEATAAQAPPLGVADTAAPAAEPSSAPTSQAAGPTAAQTVKLVAAQTRQIRQIEHLGLPIGWTEHAKRMLLLPLQGQDNDDGSTNTRVPAYQLVLGGMHIVLGYLFTALAVSLGAPFWFDMLNRLIVVRGALKSQEKAEQAAKASAAIAAGAVVAATAAGLGEGDTAAASQSNDRDIYAQIPEIADKLFEEWH